MDLRQLWGNPPQWGFGVIQTIICKKWATAFRSPLTRWGYFQKCSPRPRRIISTIPVPGELTRSPYRSRGANRNTYFFVVSLQDDDRLVFAGQMASLIRDWHQAWLRRYPRNRLL